ncbi:MAG: ATP-binding protein, partial [Halobacteria archaeon]|nr:ATP-binding protein [Halobacteria archaeon]
ASPSIEDAVEELIENAIVHNDSDEARVKVSVLNDGTDTRIRVEDNASPINDDEINVLTGEHNIDPLHHGSGLGLWLVNWAVRNSNGELYFDQKDGGNVVTVRLESAE